MDWKIKYNNFIIFYKFVFYTNLTYFFQTWKKKF